MPGPVRPTNDGFVSESGERVLREVLAGPRPAETSTVMEGEDLSAARAALLRMQAAQQAARAQTKSTGTKK